MIDITGRYYIKAQNILIEFANFCAQTFRYLFTSRIRKKEVLEQLHFVFVQSAPIIAICVSFAAAVTIVEASFHMKLIIKNDALVPGFAALMILRELGVVIAALLVTSRVGAGFAAEVATMKITEQLDALTMLGINPIKYIVVPRLIACAIGGVLLSFFANIICLYVAMMITNYTLGYSPQVFIVSMRTFVGVQDLMFAAIKGGIFGGILPLICCFYGFRCKAGAEGVGRATTNSVVVATVSIIVIDFLLTWLFANFY